MVEVNIFINFIVCTYLDMTSILFLTCFCSEKFQSGRVYCPDDEKKMALWMLCNFTYYNENEINHLCRMIYKNLLHDIAQRDGLDSNEKLADAFKNIYFAAMGNAGESGGFYYIFLGRNRGLVWIDFVIHLLYLMMKQKR